MIEHLIDEFREIILFLCARYRVDDKYDAFFVAHLVAKLQKKA
jgi:hypothetical protein